jgi:excisionase family DNA binding protein/PAS domain S-box-containing protein
MEKTLFSTPELAQWLGVFHTTVRRWIERGRIRGIRVGRNYKIPAEEVIRILEGHGIPLPEAVRRYRQRQKNEAISFPSHSEYGGSSILRKLLIVEEIEAPAFVCRRNSILGGNRDFADLVGYTQADLIGLDIAAVVEESSSEKLVDFAQRRIKTPEKGPTSYVTFLKTSQNQKKKAKITAGSLDHIKDVFLLIVKDA